MKRFAKILLVLSAFLFFFGCAGKDMVELPPFDAVSFDKNNYTSKVDTFLILFDASSSMSQDGKTYNKFKVARGLVDRMNAMLPELNQTAGLRSCGHSVNVSEKETELFYGMERYSTAKLKAGFDKITEAGGPSPLFKAIDAAVDDFAKYKNGSKAVVFISDGLDLPGNIIASAKNLKKTYPNICFYPILVGQAPEGEALMKEIAAIGKCGFYSTGDQLLTTAGMATFVEKAFLNRKAGVPKMTIKTDSDMDGVYDDVDQCPDTPKGVMVNAVGCGILANVLFGYNEDTVRTEAYPKLNNVVDLIGKNFGMKLILEGHCDSRGSAAYNDALSLRRANAVKEYLISKGVRESRIEVKGFGESKPVASNNTDEGRAQNRRVEVNAQK